MFKNMRITVSPPDRALALPSAVLSFFLMLLIAALEQAAPGQLLLAVSYGDGSDVV